MKAFGRSRILSPAEAAAAVSSIRSAPRWLWRGDRSQQEECLLAITQEALPALAGHGLPSSRIDVDVERPIGLQDEWDPTLFDNAFSAVAQNRRVAFSLMFHSSTAKCRQNARPRPDWHESLLVTAYPDVCRKEPPRYFVSVFPAFRIPPERSRQRMCQLLKSLSLENDLTITLNGPASTEPFALPAVGALLGNGFDHRGRVAGKAVFDGIPAEGCPVHRLNIGNLTREQAFSAFHMMRETYPDPCRFEYKIEIGASLADYDSLRPWIMSWSPAPWILFAVNFKAKARFGPEEMLAEHPPDTLVPMDLLGFKGPEVITWDAVRKEGGWEFWFVHLGGGSKARMAAYREKLALASGIPDLFDRPQEFWNGGDLG